MKKEELLGHLEMWHKLDKLALNSNIIIPFTDVKHKNCSRAYKEIVALIKKTEVTDEWIEEKAKELLDITSDKDFSASVREWNAEDFIRSLMEDVSITVDPHGKSGK